MLTERPHRVDRLRGSPSSARAPETPHVSVARAPVPIRSDAGIGVDGLRWPGCNNPGAQKRRLEAYVAAYLRGLRTVRT